MHWILKRNDNDDTVNLPPDLRWSDEFEWSNLAQSSPERTRGGANVIQQSVKLSGRPITLTTDDKVWIERGIIKKLQEWTAVPKLKMTLTHYDGTTYQVTFRTHDQALDVEPALFEMPETDKSNYTGTIKLITI